MEKYNSVRKRDRELSICLSYRYIDSVCVDMVKYKNKSQIRNLSLTTLYPYI
jgi:hypothetical protein